MSSTLKPSSWRLEKIAVIGAGIVGVPMAALLAEARVRQGTDKPARVVLIQRNSATSGWKVPAINSGRSPIGGIEPRLDGIIAETVSQGTLSASHNYADLRDADVILVCVQTDKAGFGPDYGPLFAALDMTAKELLRRPAGKIPLVIFESTLAPTSMGTLIRERFSRYGLEQGRDILLGNSPNRVMPGRLVERIISSDKVIGGLDPLTPRLIRALYANVVRKGGLHLTNSLTAEIIKTLENAYRDVRIAFSAEIARYCDDRDISFYEVRDQVNQRLAWSDAASSDSGAVPSGGVLVPTIGVGGHCLPKDGILLLWRKIEAGFDMKESLILESRRINDESPAEVIRLAERHFGDLSGKAVALLGAAYRPDSEDTRNSPALVLARQLRSKKCAVRIHDPYVRPGDQNLTGSALADCFTRDLEKAISEAEYILLGTAHRCYFDDLHVWIDAAPRLKGIFDGCNLLRRADLEGRKTKYEGIGRGRKSPPPQFVNFADKGFQAVERGFSAEVQSFVDFANETYAGENFGRVDFRQVQRIAGTCATGCNIVDPGPVGRIRPYGRFLPRLVRCAKDISARRMGRVYAGGSINET
jgi:UDP-N-acetyl-D-mannosaminuronic acid dehydrogenase